VKPKDALPAVIDTVTTATTAAAIAIDYVKNVRIGELNDRDSCSDDFSIKLWSGRLRKLRTGALIPKRAKIIYTGEDRIWSDAPVTEKEDCTVIFRTESAYHTLVYRLTFHGIKEDTLEGTLDDGRPMVSFDAEDSVGIDIDYEEIRNPQDVERYPCRVFNWFKKCNDDFSILYGDCFFEIPSRENNPQLFTLALNLELAASTEVQGGKKRYNSIKRLLKEIGCGNVYVNDVYGTRPYVESTDVAVGSKRWKDYNLIFLALNGAHYSTEFAANVMIGEEGEHKGFALSRDEGLKALRTFIDRYGVTGKTKLLVTGYSRTAAGSNLLGKYLSDAVAEDAVKERIGDIELVQDDLYVYSFETPLCGYYEEGKGMVPPDDPRYDNLWYVTNPDDPVTYVPTEKYGFVRYGKRVILNPDHDPEVNRRMLSYIRSYYGDSAVPFYDMSRFRRVGDLRYMEDVNKGFVKKFFDALGTREFYHDTIENDFVRTIYLGSTNENNMKDIIRELGGIKGCLSTLRIYTKDKAKFVEHLKPYVERSTARYGNEGYSENIVNTATQVMDLLNRYSEGSLPRLLGDKYIQTMLLNASRVIKCHYPEMTLAYMMMNDRYYAVPYIEAEPDSDGEPSEDQTEASGSE